MTQRARTGPRRTHVTFPLPQTDRCYLCAIVAGELAGWNVIHRGESTLTILNGRQFEIGQCMILPVRHAPTLLDLTEQEEAAVMAAAKRLTQAMVDAFAPDGVLLYQNNGVGAGQEVPHFHLHVVPRGPVATGDSGRRTSRDSRGKAAPRISIIPWSPTASCKPSRSCDGTSRDSPCRTRNR